MHPSMFIVFYLLSFSIAQTAHHPGQPLGPLAARLQSPDKQGQLTDADRISRLKRSLEITRERLRELQTQLDHPTKEYVQTEDKFRRLDAALQKKNEELALLPTDKTNEIQQTKNAMDLLVKEIGPLRDRFNQYLQERKLRVEKLASLKELIRLDQESLDSLMGTAKPIPQGVPTSPSYPAAVGKLPTSMPKEDGGTQLPGIVIGQPVLPPVVSTQPIAPAKLSPELVEAQEQAKTKLMEAEKARNEADSFNEKMQIHRKNIEIEKSLLESAKRKVDLEQRRHDDMVNDQEKLLQKSPSQESWQQAWKKRAESTSSLNAARREMRENADRLEALQHQLSQLQAEELEARNQALSKQNEAVAAEQKVEQLQNPFTFQKIHNWLLQHSIRLIAIIVGMYLMRKLILHFGKRVVTIISHHHHRGSEKDRVNRAETLVDVFRNSVSMLVIVGGLLMIGDEIGVPITPLLGGAAMMGIALAFGAQNLIRDYFTGFMILLEDQYAIKDVVKIGTISGMVEKITLRMTVLRDLEGVVHFIPHGTITTVSNLTHGWSRAMLDVNISLNEDPDRILELLRNIAIDMRKDAHFGQFIVEDPEMLGVESISNSGITIRFLIKTIPLQQWTVRRELLRRIKQRFDLLKIEVPIPQQTFNVRTLPADVVRT